MPVFNRGFTLIEMMVASASMMIFFAASAVILQTGLTSLGDAKLRSEALHIAQSRLEMAKNLSYDNVGTLGGIPAGTLSPLETVTVNGRTFTVTTSVVYIDDPYDGVAPADLLPVDYKRVRVSVTSNQDNKLRNSVVLLGDVVPKGVESLPGTGMLSILVFNAQGVAVANASVHIEASSVSPAILIDTVTDNEGRLTLPGAPICTNCYHISTTKNGFTSDRTYDTSEVANPIKPHVSVLESQISEISFAIDTVSSIALRVSRSAASNYSPFMGVQMTLKGNKLIGYTVDGDPVYKINQSVVSGSGGLITVNNLDWDSYTISIPSSSSVDFAGSWPINPITLNPGSTVNTAVVVEPATTNTLLIQLIDELQQPLTTAQAELTKGGFVATKSAGLATQGDKSQIFFNNLPANQYNLTITSPGYVATTAEITVSGDRLEQFIMATASASP